MALDEPSTHDPDQTWLLDPIAGTDSAEPPPYRARHARRPGGDSLANLGKALGAVVGGCAVVAGLVFVLDLGHSHVNARKPSTHRQAVALPTAPGGNAAPGSSAATTTKATSAPSRSSASASPSATPHRSRSATHETARTSAAAAVAMHSTSRSRPSTSRSHSAAPSTSYLTYTIPGHSFTGNITLSMPAGWTITGSSGAMSRMGNTWNVVLSELTVRVAGPAGSRETMTATLDPAIGNTYQRSYELN